MEIRKLLEEVFLSKDKEFDDRHIHPRIDEFLSKIENAGMPQRKEHEKWCRTFQGTNFQCNCMNPDYNLCYDLWFPYHLKKMEERVDVEKIKDIIQNKLGLLNEDVAKDLAQTIAKEIVK